MPPKKQERAIAACPFGSQEGKGVGSTMGNAETVIDYVAREQRTFSEEPLGPLDSLAFSVLVYLNFEEYPRGGVGTSDVVLLHDVLSLTSAEALARNSWLEYSGEDATSFLMAARASRRLRDVRVGFYALETSEAVEKQFCAATFFLPDGSAFAAFRGTDGTLAGWKEDFNLCFRDVIPSQRTAAAYLSGVASSFAGPLALGGHSKGGNLAEYAALVCDEAVYARIVGVYNHDGPSFLTDPSPRIDEERFAALLHKTVPNTSVFGMLLEKRRDYRIVASDALPLLSHSPFSWLVDGGDFMYEDELERSAVVFDRTLDDWLRSVSREERGLFIDTVYDLVTSTNSATWAEFQESLVANIRTVLARGAGLDDKTRKFVVRTFANAFAILGKTTARELLGSVKGDGGAKATEEPQTEDGER